MANGAFSAGTGGKLVLQLLNCCKPDSCSWQDMDAA
jgi:hypothetical protein